MLSKILAVWASVAVLAVLALVPDAAKAYNNGYGRTPPMGHDTWCTDDACGLLDMCWSSQIRQQARALVTTGMRDLGYEWVLMDDCWSAETRDANGNLQPDAKRFPEGMKALADYVHGLGLKLGAYACIGTKTCRRGRPGSFGHYEQDARQFQAWGLDQVKVDNCNKPGAYSERDLYANFSRAINATGHKMWFALCEWGNSRVQDWGGTVGQTYRIQMDHLPFYWLPTRAAGKGFGQGTAQIISYVGTLRPSTFVRPYAWMDPDFLMTMFGIGKLVTMDYIASRTEFTFWSFWSAPLIVATQVSNLTTQALEILRNKDVIAIDQDPMGVAGDLAVNNSDGTQIWTRPLADGSAAVLLFNSQLVGASRRVTVASWAALGIGRGANATRPIVARDLWAHANASGYFKVADGYNVAIAPRDVQLLRLRCMPAPCISRKRS